MLIYTYPHGPNTTCLHNFDIYAFSFCCLIYRNVYEYMITRQREKRRGRNGKGESFSMQQLQAAYDEYDEEATLFVFRLKSLKQGQSRSLLTQAARHHAAQVFFFLFFELIYFFLGSIWTIIYFPSSLLNHESSCASSRRLLNLLKHLSHM